jgi:hypothetical protein
LGVLDAKDATHLESDDSSALYSVGSSGQGYLLFARNRVLVAQRFDATRFRPEGEPFPIADQVQLNESAYGSFSVSDAGDLFYNPAGFVNGQLTWFDRNGKPLGVVGTAGVQRPSLSPTTRRWP